VTVFDRMTRTARSRKLCKDPANGIIFGVCAGIAWWLGVQRWVVRLAAIVAVILWTGPAIIAYVAAALLLKSRPVSRYEEFVDRYGDIGRGSDRSRWESSRWDRCERGW